MMIIKYITFAIVLEICIVSCSGKSKYTCNEIRGRCEARMGCAWALHTFSIACDSLMNGFSDECTKQCQRSLVSLISSESGDGLEFMNCDCGPEGTEEVDYCNEKKRRVQMCATDVINAWKSMNDSRVNISCELALWMCQADSACNTALTYFTEHCSTLIKGQKCTDRCNNSINILYSQKQAQKLRNCQCEGTEIGYNCEKLKKYTDFLCYNKSVSYRYTGSRTGTNGRGSASVRLCSLMAVKSFIMVTLLISRLFNFLIS